MTTLHATKVLAYFLEQQGIYTKNCSKNILSNFEKKFAANRGNLPIFHEAENLTFDIFTCYVRTSMALVPSQCIKICWTLKWKCEIYSGK